MRVADHGGLGDLGVGDEGGFDLRGAHAVAGDVDHVVDPAGDPPVAVGVAAAAVAGEIVALVLGEVGRHEALVVAEDGAHLAGPAAIDREDAGGLGLGELGAGVRVEDHGLDAEEGQGRRAGLGRDGAGERG